MEQYWIVITYLYEAAIEEQAKYGTAAEVAELSELPPDLFFLQLSASESEGQASFMEVSHR